MLLVLGAVALAAQPDPRLEVSVGTTFPVSVAIGGDFDAGIVHAAGRVGLMPEPYADGINAVVVGLGGWDEATAALVDDVLGPSLAVDADLGFGLPNGRLYGAVGVAVVTLGGGITRLDLVEEVTGTELPDEADAIVRQLDLRAKTSLVNVKVLVGSRVPLPDPFVFRAELGGIHTIAARSKLKADGRELHGPSALLDDYLDDIYTSYVWSPTVGVRVGWGF